MVKKAVVNPKKAKETKKKEEEKRKIPKKIERVAFKKKAPRAIRYIRTFAKKTFHVRRVYLDPSVNLAIWKGGIRSIPRRVRVSIARRRVDSGADNKDGGKESAPGSNWGKVPDHYICEVRHVNVKSFRNLQTVRKNEDE